MRKQESNIYKKPHPRLKAEEEATIKADKEARIEDKEEARLKAEEKARLKVTVILLQMATDTYVKTSGFIISCDVSSYKSSNSRRIR